MFGSVRTDGAVRVLLHLGSG